MSSLLFNCSFLFSFSATGRCTSSHHPRDTFMISERWEMEKEAVTELQAAPTRLGLFPLLSLALRLLTCLYPAASPLAMV